MNHSEDIHQLLATKSSLKQRTHRNTIEVFQRMKKVLESIAKEQHDKIKGVDAYVPVSYQSRSQFEAQIQFSGDVLLLQQHTNTFTFPTDHPIHNNSYVKTNPSAILLGTTTFDICCIARFAVCATVTDATVVFCGFT